MPCPFSFYVGGFMASLFEADIASLKGVGSKRAELFRKLDQVSLRRHPDTAGIVSALERANLGDICRRMYNVFEDVNDRRMRTVMAIKTVLIDHGALGAVMTGTGSAVFGIFTDKAAAEAARDELKKDYGFCCLAVGVRALA